TKIRFIHQVFNFILKDPQGGHEFMGSISRKLSFLLECCMNLIHQQDKRIIQISKIGSRSFYRSQILVKRKLSVADTAVYDLPEWIKQVTGISQIKQDGNEDES